VSMAITWLSNVHASKPTQTNLGLSMLSPITVHAMHIVSLNLLNSVSLALSWMQESQSSTSIDDMVGCPIYHIKQANCIRMLNCQQYWKMAINLVTYWTCSNMRLVGEDVGFRLLMTRNHMIGWLVCRFGWMTI
jgi:hypothetical protein